MQRWWELANLLRRTEEAEVECRWLFIDAPELQPALSWERPWDTDNLKLGAKAEVGCDPGRCKGNTEALPLTEHVSVPCLVPRLVHAHFI